MSEDGPGPNGEEPPPKTTLAVEVMRHGGAWDDAAISDAVVRRAALASFTEASPETPSHCEVAIVFTDNEEMRALNRTWRNKDAPTNVLSFPAGDTPHGDGTLGDIVIAYETSRAEANQTGIPLSDHISHLVVHGVLHLLGFDHLDDVEAEQMEDLERKALSSLGIADPYGQGREGRLAEISR